MFLDYNMKKIILLILGLSCISLSSEGSIAVMKLDAIGISKKEARVLTERITSQMISCGKYTVLDRNNTDKILDEMKFQSSGCTDTQCAIEVGKILNAHYILVGSVSSFGNNYIMDCRIINVETSEAVKSASYTTRKNLDKLLLGTNNIVSQLCDIQLEEMDDDSVEDKNSKNDKKKALARAIYRTGGLYLGWNISGRYSTNRTYDGDTGDIIFIDNDYYYDSGGFTIGYEIGKLQSKEEFGISLDLGGFRYNRGSGDNDERTGDKFLNAYWKRNFSKSSPFNFWTSVGYNIGLGQLDEEDWAGQYSYGIGLEGDRFEIGGLVNRCRADAPNTYFEVFRIFVNYNFPKFKYSDKKKKQQKKKNQQKRKRKK